SPAGIGTVDVTVTTEAGTSAISSGDRFTYGPVGTTTTGPAGTTTTLSSSQNPSSFGQPVKFTATVTGLSPTGSVSLFDGGTQIGTGTLAAGTASFTISSLAVGSHSLTAQYSGDPNNAASTSAALIQTVNVPADSIKLREMQVSVTPMIAQISGQAIVGAIDYAIDAGFSENPQALTPNGAGFSFQTALGPAAAPTGSGGNRTEGRVRGSAGARTQRTGCRAGMVRRPAHVSLTCQSYRCRPVQACRQLAKRSFRRTTGGPVRFRHDAAADRQHRTALRPYHCGARNHRHAGPHCLHLPHRQRAIRARGDPPCRGRWAPRRGAAQIYLSPGTGSQQSQCRSGRSSKIYREQLSVCRGAPDHQGRQSRRCGDRFGDRLQPTQSRRHGQRPIRRRLRY